MPANSNELDMEGILGRLLEATKYKNLSKLGEVLGLSANALSQSKVRKSIALWVLLKCQELAKEADNVVSLDYLVHGEKCTGVIGKNIGKDKSGFEGVDDEYIEIAALDEDAPVRSPVIFNKAWLELFIVFKKDLSPLRSYLLNDQLYIIDTSDTVLGDGVFAFSIYFVSAQPLIRHCRMLVDGSCEIAGEKAITPEDINSKVKVLGRVVWKSAAIRKTA